MKSLRISIVFSMLLGIFSCSQAQKHSADTKKREVQKTDAEWKEILTPDAYYILREAGTERPFTSALNKNKKEGIYECAACHTPLFSSKTKFDSGTGWPSFYKPLFAKNIDEEEDRSLGGVRTEVLCNTCGGHLGHVFDDGPKPTGLRYCLNGDALVFEAKRVK